VCSDWEFTKVEKSNIHVSPFFFPLTSTLTHPFALSRTTLCWLNIDEHSVTAILSKGHEVCPFFEPFGISDFCSWFHWSFGSAKNVKKWSGLTSSLRHWYRSQFQAHIFISIIIGDNTSRNSYGTGCPLSSTLLVLTKLFSTKILVSNHKALVLWLYDFHQLTLTEASSCSGICSHSSTVGNLL
jgi:hypothetical protein